MESGPNTPSPDLKSRPRLVHSLIPVVGSAVLLGVGFGIYRIRVEVLLIAATCLAGGMARWLGLGWREIQAGMMQSIMKGLPAILVVVVVGSLIGSWMAAGIIPMIIHSGLGLITPKWFLVTASLATGIVSVLTGTGFGTIGTVGVAFMGIAHGLGVPPAEAAGALVSGAYLGDKVSPFAANANLAVAVSQANIFDHIRHSLWTTLPALAVALAVYGVTGGKASLQPAASGGDDGLRSALASHFTFSGWLIVPPLITLYAMVRNRPVIPGMLLSAGTAVLLAVAVQHLAIADAVGAMVTGYASHSGVAPLDKLLSQGGMLSMMPVTLIALCAFAFGGVMQCAGLFEPLLDRLHRFANTPGRLIATTGASCVAVELMTGSAFLCILLPSELFAPAFRRMDLAAKNLSRTIADFGIAGVPLIPWSIAAAFMSGTLGVAVTEYAPWAVFCYAGAVFTLLSGFTGLAVARRRTDDETQPGS
jgi:NhaC family Na+:H+ antiporter